MLKVADLMTATPICVALDTPLAECRGLFTRHRIRHLLVTNALGHLAGYLSEPAVAAREATGATVGDLLEPVDVALTTESPAPDALRALLGTDWDFLAVVDRHRVPVGILTEHDLMRLAAEVLHPDLRASQAATGNVVTARRTELASSALRRMEARHLRHLVVVDEMGSLAGVLSWRDMVRADVGPESRSTVQDLIAGQEVQKLVLDASLRTAAATMRDHKVGALPIVDQRGMVLWLVTRTDVMRHLGEHLAANP